MKVLSVNVGLPRTLEWGGENVTTAIFKTPAPGPVAVRTLNIDGDRQADLTVHGGERKAVYAYPHEHYAFWHGELPDARECRATSWASDSDGSTWSSGSGAAGDAASTSR